jgi:hypothetical protein
VFIYVTLSSWYCLCVQQFNQLTNDMQSKLCAKTMLPLDFHDMHSSNCFYVFCVNWNSAVFHTKDIHNKHVALRNRCLISPLLFWWVLIDGSMLLYAFLLVICCCQHAVLHLTNIITFVCTRKKFILVLYLIHETKLKQYLKSLTMLKYLQMYRFFCHT